MTKYNKLLFTLPLFIYLSGCGATNKTLKSEDTREISIHKEMPIIIPANKPANKETKVSKVNTVKYKKKRVKPARKAETKQPKEVERVCFDKQGTAHNCNYKIPKPYNNEIRKQELYSQ